MWDRFYDHYVQEPMQKIVTDRLRPEGKNDAYGVELAKVQLRAAYRVIEQEMQSKVWTMGNDFTLADCAAAPALFYANTVVPFAEAYKNLPAYLDRLMARPSFAQVLEEAQPYFGLFPMERKPQIARLGRVASG
jgi:glutathione S-transferase